MTCSNWAFLFLGRDELETCSTQQAGRKKKKLKRQREKNPEEGKNANLLPFLRLMKQDTEMKRELFFPLNVLLLFCLNLALHVFCSQERPPHRNHTMLSTVTLISLTVFRKVV